MKTYDLQKRFKEKGYHLFHANGHTGIGWYAVKNNDIENGNFAMLDAKFVSSSLKGCKDSIILI